MFLPVMINIKRKKITIVGGGKIAYRKVKKLLDYDSKVTVISPQFIDDFNRINNQIEIINKCYNSKLIEDSFLVYAATSSETVNKEINKFCKENNILCNVVDDFEISDFITPSLIKRGDLNISVSTSGKSPSLTSKIIKDLKKIYTEEFDEYLKFLGELRIIVKEKCDDAERKKTILNEAINLNIHELKLLIKEYSEKSSL